MSRYTDKFDTICGNCTGINMFDITVEDIRAQAKIWTQQGETVTESDISDAMQGLIEYQREINPPL